MLDRIKQMAEEADPYMATGDALDRWGALHSLTPARAFGESDDSYRKRLLDEIKDAQQAIRARYGIKE